MALIDEKTRFTVLMPISRIITHITFICKHLKCLQIHGDAQNAEHN